MRQIIKNSAVLRSSFLDAQSPQYFQVLLQFLQFYNPLRHVTEMLIQQLIDFLAVAFRHIAKPQQCANLCECHVERTTTAHAQELLNVEHAM